MTIGVVILAHTHLNRVRQVVRSIASRECKVAIHIDANTDDAEASLLEKTFRKNPHVIFVDRLPCDWGGFNLIRAGLNAASMLIDTWGEVEHVIQISGSCVPIRPMSELRAFLKDHPKTDFVESVPAHNDDWVKGGLSVERFTLYFPFSWKKQRWLFDRSVDLQRWLGVSRKCPPGITPHLGSQWWCLHVDTLRAILDDPQRPQLERFFSLCWIPDEGYIASMVRRHSRNLNARSLTLSRFDDQGKPHLFYDDHADLLAQTDCFFARKIWHGADKLYRRFASKPNRKANPKRPIETDFGLDLLFDNAQRRRCEGRPGRLNAGRFPAAAHERQPTTVAPYGVLFGLSHVFDDLETWLARTSGLLAHGRLFKNNEIQFAPGFTAMGGAICDNPQIRDVNPEQFLCNVLWNHQARKHALLMDHADGLRIGQYFANDPNAQIFLLSGSWIIDLYQRNNPNFHQTVQQAQKLSLIEAKVDAEIAENGFDTVHRTTLLDICDAPQRYLDFIGHSLRPEIDLRPRADITLRNLSGLANFAARLAEAGVDTSSLGDIPAASHQPIALPDTSIAQAK